LLPLLVTMSLAMAAPALAQDAETSTPAASPTAKPESEAPRAPMGSVKGPGGRNITAFDRHVQSGIGGYYDIEFKQPFNGLGSSFDLHHLILQTSSYLHDNLFFNAEIEFEHGGLINTLSNDGELEIEQAWVDYTISELLTMRAGVVLIPFGIVNVLHDSDVRETTTRPLMASTIIPTTWFEPGVGIHGLAYPTEDLMVSYEAYVTQGLTDKISPEFGLRAARPSLATDNNGNKAVSARVAVSPFLGLEVALDGYHAAYDPAGVQHLTMVGADASYAVGPFEFLGEVAQASTRGGTSTGTGVPAAIPTGMGGYYLEGRYRFFPSFLDNTFLGRGGGFQNATFTAFARGGAVDTNQAAFDRSDRNELLVGLNYRPIQTFVVKLEAQHLTEPATGRTDDTLWTSVAVGF
jgi:hypothetical protein